MLVLMLGITMKQDWNVAGQQLLFGLALAVLLSGCERLNPGWPALLRGR